MDDTELQFELGRAITGNELFLQYQPRVLVTTRTLRGVEALVRWHHRTRGTVPPAEFIAAAERSGLMRDLEAWVIREAMLQAGVWQRDGVRLGVSVNITASLLGDEAFLRLAERTMKIQRDPGTVTFEVAAASLAAVEPPIAGLVRLRERGIRLALDDVTSLDELEASSWNRWDYVKPGRRLVAEAGRSVAAGATLRALVARATELGAKIQAVGVEDEATIALLHDAGAYSMQGYAIAAPLGVKELWSWSEGRRRAT